MPVSLLARAACTADLKRRARRRVPRFAFDYLEGQLESGAEGLVGGRFSIADIAIGTMLAQMIHARLDLDARRWPKLVAYRDRLLARPSFKACIEEEKQILASLAKK